MFTTVLIPFSQLMCVQTEEEINSFKGLDKNHTARAVRSAGAVELERASLPASVLMIHDFVELSRINNCILLLSLVRPKELNMLGRHQEPGPVRRLLHLFGDHAHRIPVLHQARCKDRSQVMQIYSFFIPLIGIFVLTI